MPITTEDALQNARRVWFGADSDEKPHAADDLLMDTLMADLTGETGATRRGRALAGSAKGLWDPKAEDNIVDNLSSVPGIEEPENEQDQVAKQFGLMEFEDTFTGERVRNRKTEVLSRYTEMIIGYGTPILNGFFTTQRMDAGTGLSALKEIVDYVEQMDQMGYYPIDIDRGDIRTFRPSSSQASQRINPQMSMYGVQVEYENKLHRVLDNFSTGEILAMAVLGWSQASQEVRERDASHYLTEFLSPTIALSNKDGRDTPLGQASGVAINGTPNGTLDVDYDVPRIMDFMLHEVGMNTNQLQALMPQDAWSALNMRKGYRRFIGRDGAPLYESPEFTEGPRGAFGSGENNNAFGTNTEQYGISARGAGFETPGGAANYLQGTRRAEAQQAASQMPAGPFAFLPKRIPNLMNEFRLPNSAFGPMSVTLTPFETTEQMLYREGHDLRADEHGRERNVKTTDMLLFDGTRPLYMIESIPPTSWDATNEQYQKSVVVMVEAYALANRSRGEQAIKLEGLVLDDNYTHEIRLMADKIKMTQDPLGGTDNGSGLVSN